MESPQLMAALVGAVVITATGSVELIKYVVSKRNGRPNGGFSADDREKLTELRLLAKQQYDQGKEQTRLLRECVDQLKLVAMRVQG